MSNLSLPLTLSDKDKATLDQYMKGQTANEFPQTAQDLVDKINRYHGDQMSATISKSFVNFHGQGDPIEVTDFEDPRHFQEDEVIITNTHKSKELYVDVRYFPVAKYALEMTPGFFVVPKNGGSVAINFKIRCFCTTKSYHMVRLSLSREKNIKYSLDYTGLKSRIDPEDGESGQFYLIFKVETMLSSYLDWDEIKLTKEIGRGGYGTVYCCKWRNTSEYAVKILNAYIDEDFRFIQREMDVHRKLTNPYIIQTMGCTRVPGQPFAIFMELAKNGSLKSFLDPQVRILDDQFKGKLALDIAKGVQFLHSVNIFHRDLKPANILLMHKGRDLNTVNGKITDFGTAKAFVKNLQTYIDRRQVAQAIREEKSRRELKSQNTTSTFMRESTMPKDVTKGVGTLLYQAPEILRGQTEDLLLQKTDTYSFGIMLWEIWHQMEPYGEPPFDKDSRKLVDHILGGKRLKWSEAVPKEIRKLTEECWDHDPNHRPDFATIVERLEKLVPILSPKPPEDPTVLLPKDYVLPEGVSNPFPLSVPVNQDDLATVSLLTQSLLLTTQRSSPSHTIIRDSGSSANSNSSSQFFPNTTTAPGPSNSSSQYPISPPHGASSQNLATSQFASHVDNSEVDSSRIPELKNDDHAEIAYFHSISRDEANKKLESWPIGTFLVRWSAREKSLVLSYKCEPTPELKSGFNHVAYIYETKAGTILVSRIGGTTSPYKNMAEYLNFMRSQGKITQPYREKVEYENNYTISPFANKN